MTPPKNKKQEKEESKATRVLAAETVPQVLIQIILSINFKDLNIFSSAGTTYSNSTQIHNPQKSRNQGQPSPAFPSSVGNVAINTRLSAWFFISFLKKNKKLNVSIPAKHYSLISINVVSKIFPALHTYIHSWFTSQPRPTQTKPNQTKPGTNPSYY